MIYRNIGNTEIKASVIGLGTWGISGWQWGGTDMEESIRAIHASIDAGINLIDTAPIYGMGLAEEIVARAVKDRRDKVIIATKCGLLWDDSKKGADRDSTIRLSLKPESIRKEAEASLLRLKTDHIDLYQTHWQDADVPVEYVMEELLKLKDEGKIRAIGVCNINVKQLEEYSNAGFFESDQERFSMIDREIEGEILPWCRKHSKAVLAYSPLAQGLLTGKVGPGRKFTGDDQRINDPRFSMENRLKIAGILEELEPYAQTCKVTIPQLVIAWNVAQQGITHVLCGARNVMQAEENAGAGDAILNEKDIAEINGIIAKFKMQE